MADKRVFVFLGVYGNPVDATADLELVRRLHSDGVIGTYDAGIAVKQVDGSVTVEKHEKPHTARRLDRHRRRRRGRRSLPPSIIGLAAVGGISGGLIGHFWKGMSRKDVTELGEALDTGEALLIVVGHDKLEEALRKAGLKAQKQVEKQIDMDSKELDKQLGEAEKELAKS